MPPRHAYWTILVGDSPTAFRAADRADLLPTFERLKQKHPDVVLKWFARGQLWESQEAQRAAERPARPTADREGRGPGVAARRIASGSARSLQAEASRGSWARGASGP